MPNLPTVMGPVGVGAALVVDTIVALPVAVGADVTVVEVAETGT